MTALLRSAKTNCRISWCGERLPAKKSYWQVKQSWVGSRLGLMCGRRWSPTLGLHCYLVNSDDAPGWLLFFWLGAPLPLTEFKGEAGGGVKRNQELQQCTRQVETGPKWKREGARERETTKCVCRSQEWGYIWWKKTNRSGVNNKVLSYNMCLLVLHACASTTASRVKKQQNMILNYINLSIADDRESRLHSVMVSCKAAELQENCAKEECRLLSVSTCWEGEQQWTERSPALEFYTLQNLMSMISTDEKLLKVLAWYLPWYHRSQLVISRFLFTWPRLLWCHTL